MITIENVNNQLKITRDTVVEFYSFNDIKSVTPYYSPVVKFSSTSGQSYVIINFINENRNSSLRLPFKEINPSLGYANPEAVVAAISSWMSGAGASANRTPYMLRSTTTGTITGAYSVSISNVGAADATVLSSTLKASETVNFDAGAIGNVLGNVAYTATGTELLIIYIK
jgi:hypothetical protein